MPIQTDRLLQYDSPTTLGLADGILSKPSLYFQNERSTGLHRAGSGKSYYDVLGSSISLFDSKGVHFGVGPTVDVRFYGAIGDGVHDDTAAFVASIASLPLAGGSIFIPVGIYKITSTLVGRSNITIKGIYGGILDTGPVPQVTGSVLLWAGTTGIPVLSFTDCEYVILEDFAISGGTIANTTGILIDSTNTPATHNIYIRDLFLDSIGTASTNGVGIQIANTPGLVATTDGHITSGAAILTSATAGFTAALVGRRITVSGAGVAGATLSAMVTAYTSASSITLGTNASTTVVAATVLVTNCQADMIEIRRCTIRNTNTGIYVDSVNAMDNAVCEQINFTGAIHYGFQLTLSGPFEIRECAFGTTLSGSVAFVNILGSHSALLIERCNVEGTVSGSDFSLQTSGAAAVSNYTITLINNTFGLPISIAAQANITSLGNMIQSGDFTLSANNCTVISDGDYFDSGAFVRTGTGTQVWRKYANGNPPANQVITGVHTSGPALTITNEYVNGAGTVNGKNLEMINQAAGARTWDWLLPATGHGLGGAIAAGALVLSDSTAGTYPFVVDGTPLADAVHITSAGVTLKGTLGLPNLSVTNAMLAGSIAYSKLSLTGAILNADLAGSIAYSKLSLTGAILNADLAGSIAYSKLSLTGAVLNADLAGSIAATKVLAGAFAGSAALTAPKKLYPNGNSSGYFDVKDHGSIANAAALVQLCNDLLPAAIVFVRESFNASVAIFNLRGTANASFLISDPVSIFANTNTAGKICIYYDAGTGGYVLDNNYNTCSFTVFVFGV